MAFKILVIDDCENDRFFFQRALSGSGVTAEVVYLADPAASAEVLKNNVFDCIFLDYYLPRINGLEVLKEIRQKGLDTPVIMLTGQKDEMNIVKLMHAGANDYLSKESLNPESLRLSIESTHQLYLLRKERLLADEALRYSEARLAEAQQIARLGNWEFNFNSKKLFFSQEMHNILEYSDSDVPTIKNIYRKIHPEDLGIIKDAMRRVKNGNDYDITFRICTAWGSIKYLNAIGNLVYRSNGSVEKIIGTVQDVSVLKKALYETKKATAKKRATSILFSVTIIVFLISEALLDPMIDSLATGLFLALSFKGSIAVLFRSFEGFLGKMMLRLSI